MQNKKIAIQTLRLTNNYGGILQAFALQEYLESMGHRVEHLNRYNFKTGIWPNVKNLVYFLLNYKEESVKKRVNRKFSIFINKYIKISMPIETKKLWEDFIEENNYDVIIVGSDQVWRFEYIKNLYPEFFLDINNRKIVKASYAASFGVSSIANYPKQDIEKFLNGLKGISVREIQGQQIIKDDFNLDADHHIDPTLLLSSEKYIERFNLIKKHSDFIYCYVLDKDPKKKQIIDTIQHQLKLSTKFVYGGGIEKGNFKDPDILNKPTVENWLENFFNAKFVVTDSFHGVIFSIIFKKPFIAIGNERRGMDRFTSLLGLLDLESRLIYPNGVAPLVMVKEKINYSEVNKLLDVEREKAFKYFSSIL